MNYMLMPTCAANKLDKILYRLYLRKIMQRRVERVIKNMTQEFFGGVVFVSVWPKSAAVTLVLAVWVY